MQADLELDVFVSYAHADNGVPLGAAVQHGWVTALATNLNEGPNVVKKRLFIDHQLRPGDSFDSDLLAKVERSALLVLLLSQNYIDSAWCGQELAHFIRTHSTDPEKPADVFVVELVPFERLVDVPPDIRRLRKHLIHAKFWYQRREASEPDLAGYPSALESGPEGRDHYWAVLNQLRVALDTRLRASRTRPPPPAEEPPAMYGLTHPSPHGSNERLGTVLLADPTDDLEAQRNAVKIALEAEGIVVLPSGDYIELTPLEFETAITGDLTRADLFVQLLSSTPGRKVRGFAAPLPQLQFRHARSANVPILQWCDRLPSAGQITDAAHAQLFETEYLRATNLADFKTMVIERLHADKALRERVARPEPDQILTRQHRPNIFIDDVAGEPELSDRLRAIIEQQDYSVRSLPASAPLGNNGIDVKELLRPCRAGITIYTDPGKYATAYNRLVYFLNQIADGNLPLARWGVVLRQGTVANKFGIESKEVVTIDENGLANFLRGL